MNENLNIEPNVTRLSNLNDAIKCIQVALAESSGGIEDIAGNALFEITNIIEEELSTLDSINSKIKKFKIA